MTQTRDLLARVAEKDDTAFAQLYDAFADRVFRYVLTLLHDRHLAEEVAQETMIAVWNGAHRFAGRSKASTWIFGIARNQAFTLMRREMKAEKMPRPELVEPDPSHSILRQEKVREALGDLSTEHREVVYLTFYEGLSYGEISGLLGVPEGTVKSRMFHAKRRLAEVLA